jgi:hypothetical protein
MNEETTNVIEMDDDELFFDPSDFDLDTETGDHTGEEAQEEQQAEENGTDSDPGTEQTVTETDGAQEEQANQPELFELNYLGNVEKHTREEMIALAQMGKDRDRILQQRDAAQQFRTQHEPMITDLDRIAKQFGMEPAALLNAMETNLLRQQGKTEAEAEAIIRANRADRQLQAIQTKEQTAQQQAEAMRQRQQRDVDEFVQKYPNMDYKTIPAEVWQDVRKGETLVNAYGKYEMQQLRAENQRLQQQIAAKAQNEKNKENSLGSMRSGSQTQKTDPFLDELFRD